MPEFPEIEALCRSLDGLVSAYPIEKAGPAHIATLKTFDPPLATLEGRRFEGARRRGKHLLFPTDDGELVLHVHLMSAGRMRYLEPGAKGPKTPAFRLTFQGGGSIVLTEAGAKKRAKVGLYRPDELEAELAHLGPGRARPGTGATRRDPAGRLSPAALVPPRSALAHGHRSCVGERDPAPRQALSVCTLHRPGRGRDRAPVRRDRRDPHRGARAPRKRDRGQEGLPDPQPAGRAVPCLLDAHRAHRLRRAHDLLLPAVPDRRARPQGSPALAATPVAGSSPALRRSPPTRRAPRSPSLRPELRALSVTHRRRRAPRTS